MAAFSHFRDLNDVAFKPRLLHTLLNEHLPDETRPFRNPSSLSSIVSTLKSHHLLSESFLDANEKHVSSWKFSVDAFIHRILTLSGSNLPDKCWVGICLLGVTCAECSSDRFLTSYSSWLNVLLQHIQPSGVSPLVKVASCAAASDLLSRLGRFSNVRKDGIALAGKLVQPILKTLNEDGNDAILEAATQLLSTVLMYFPSSVIRHYDHAESTIVSKIMSGSCNTNLLKKLAFCLASLPRSKGDEESWSLMMQKLLLSVSGLLNDALEGLEEESMCDKAVTLLAPPGKDCPSLGGQMMPGEALSKGERPPELLVSSISTLMQSCCAMLTTSYPVQVAIPIRAMLAVIRRVLVVNGSLPVSLQPFTTAMQQESVCSKLPLLHLSSLEVLAAAVKGVRSQLLPYAADVVHILMDYFKRCRLPELRTKLYSIVRVLLVSMSAGMALHIFQEVLKNVDIDLSLGDSESNIVPIIEQSTVEVTLQHRSKKRKHGNANESMQQHASFGSEVKIQEESPTLIALKIAAVEALEALLVVGGALKSDGWRRRLDLILIQLATDACRGFWSDHGKPLHPKEPQPMWEDFQLVALRALLASLLSPAGVRPPHLARGLELFGKGKLGKGSKVSEFCAQALLSLEVLIHPRALPLTDLSLQHGNNHFTGRMDLGGVNYKAPNVDAKFRASYGNAHDVYDFLHDIYQENGPDSEVPAIEGSKVVHFNENSGDISRSQDLKEPKIVCGSSNEMKEDEIPALTNHANQIEPEGDKVMLDLEHHEERESCGGALSFRPTSIDLVPRQKTSDIDASASCKHALAAKEITNVGVGSVVSARADSNTLKLSVAQPDNESSDSFPDIVDADPDTDSD